MPLYTFMHNLLNVLYRLQIEWDYNKIINNYVLNYRGDAQQNAICSLTALVSLSVSKAVNRHYVWDLLLT
jgi:hypothetical protein